MAKKIQTLYDQVMRQRRPAQPIEPGGVPIKTEEIETEDETDTNIFPIKTEEKVKYSCKTDGGEDGSITNKPIRMLAYYVNDSSSSQVRHRFHKYFSG